MKKFLFFIAILFLIILPAIEKLGEKYGFDVPWVSSADSSTASKAESVSDDSIEKYEVFGDRITYRGISKYITGKIKNNTSDMAVIVTVKIELYDRAGTLIGTAFDSISDLEAGETRDFTAIPSTPSIMDEFRIKSYKIVEVKGY